MYLLGTSEVTVPSEIVVFGFPYLDTLKVRSRKFDQIGVNDLILIPFSDDAQERMVR